MSRDVLIFSGLAGVLGNIPKEGLAWVLYWMGFEKYTFTHFCAGIVLNPSFHNDPIALIIGAILDFSIAAVLGFGIYLVIRKTGKQYLLLKGLFMGMMIFFICYGVLRPFLSAIEFNPTPLEVLFYLIANLVYSLTTSWFIQKFGLIIGENKQRN